MKKQRKFTQAVERRRRFLNSCFEIEKISILEIGAMDMPTFHPDEAHIHFLDYYSNLEFAEMAAAGKLSRPIEALMPVEVAVKEKYFSRKVKNKYDLIIAAHVIEHIPDPISWLNELQSILTANGEIFLAIPDRRFTFDLLRKETTPIDLYRSYIEDALEPSLYTIADFYYYKRDVGAADVWGNSTSLQEKIAGSSYSLKDALHRAKGLVGKPDTHVNIHCNVFSAPAFKELYSGLESLSPITGMTLRLKNIVDVMPGGNEFWAHLKMPEQQRAAGRTVRPSRSRKFVIGKENELFLDNDTNHVLDQISGRSLLSEKTIGQWQRLIESRVALLSKRGVDYTFAIAPAKEVVLADKLPDTLSVAGVRPATQITSRLKSASGIEINYFVDALITTEAKGGRTFRRGDTHWSGAGAFAAYTALFAEILGRHNARILSGEDVIFKTETQFGDLQIHAGEDVPETFSSVHVCDPKAKVVFNNRRPNRGNIIITENPSVPKISAVIFRDSFTEILIPLIAESFSRCIFIWQPYIDYEVVEREKPTVVMNIIAERFLLEVPDDNHNFGREEIVSLNNLKVI